MKNKLIAITLSIACVVASCVPTALANFNRIETTSVELEEVSDQPTWNVLQKENDEIQKIYQETYDRVYQETLNNLAQQQAETQANVENTMNQLKDSDAYKLLLGNNEKVVKDIDVDKNGNIIVKYTNGTKKSLNTKVASVSSGSTEAVTESAVEDSATTDDANTTKPTETPSDSPNNNKPNDEPVDNTPEYEKVGYKIPISDNCKLNGVYDYGNNNSYEWNITELDVQLVDIDSNKPSQKYHYKAKCNVSFSNINGYGMGAPFKIHLDDNFLALSISVYDDEISNELYNDFYSSVPYVSITYIGS